MRRLILYLAAMSLLAAAAIVVVWVRSYWRGDEWIWTAGSGTESDVVHIVVARGGVSYSRWQGGGATAAFPPYLHISVPGPAAYPYAEHDLSTVNWRACGFQFWVDDSGRYRAYVIPCWFLVSVMLVLPSVVGVRYLRRRKNVAGFALA